MPASNRHFTAVILLILPLCTGILSHLAALSFAAGMALLVLAGAAGAALALWRIPRIPAAESLAPAIGTPAAPTTRPMAEAAPPRPTDALATLRHDLRGILSPAVLTADKLSMNADQGIRADAEAILTALDRMTDRLRKG